MRVFFCLLVFGLALVACWRANATYRRIIEELDATGVDKRIGPFGRSFAPFASWDHVDRHRTLCPQSPLRRQFAVRMVIFVGMFVVVAITMMTLMPDLPKKQYLEHLDRQ
jgi:hypothetical protein